MLTKLEKLGIALMFSALFLTSLQPVSVSTAIIAAVFFTAGLLSFLYSGGTYPPREP